METPNHYKMYKKQFLVPFAHLTNYVFVSMNVVRPDCLVKYRGGTVTYQMEVLFRTIHAAWVPGSWRTWKQNDCLLMSCWLS